MQKYKPVYRLKVCYEARSGQKWEDREIEGRFAEWFDADGILQQTQLRKWLAQHIDVIGMADPESKGVVEEIKDGAGVAYGEVVDLTSPVPDGTNNVKGRKGKKKA